MQFEHGSGAVASIAESMLHCNIGINVLGGTIRQGSLAMTARTRPIHCNFETLRLAGERLRSGHGYHRFGSATNEQLSARVLGRLGQITRPSAIFTDFRES